MLANVLPDELTAWTDEHLWKIGKYHPSFSVIKTYKSPLPQSATVLINKKQAGKKKHIFYVIKI